MFVIDPADKDKQLVWPRVVLAMELDRRLRLLDAAVLFITRDDDYFSIIRLLRASFRGTAVSDEFGAARSDNPVEWLRNLRADLDDAESEAAARPYWSARKGGSAAALGADAVMDRFVYVVRDLDEIGLWAERFGVDCPDGNCDPSSPPDVQIEDELQRHIGGTHTWPLDRSRASWTLDDFYDLVEVVHDFASMPGRWSSHHYGGCIGHPSAFSPEVGQILYRAQVNDLLERSDLGVRLAESGEDRGRLVRSSGDGLDDLVEEALVDAPEDSIDEVRHAVALFRSRDRDRESVRSAVVALAGVLERHRGTLKRDLLSKDEGSLFEIANRFDLRHRDASQKGDYDDAHMEWVFRWYLATVSLLRHLVGRSEASLRNEPLLTDRA